MRVLLIALLAAISYAQTDYPDVLVVDVGVGTEDLETIRRYCPTGRRLVSLQDAAHLRYLKEQLQSQKGDSYFTSGEGTALGYMYNYDHRVYDLNDPSRDLSQIFQDAMDQGIINVNEADPNTAQDQPWAGFGWGNSDQIHDWSTHTTKAVFCERNVDYPDVLVVDVGVESTDIEAIRAYCPEGRQLVSLQDAGHIQYLKEELLSQKGNDYFTSSQGTALGYMYNNDHRVYDLNDPTRDLTQIFQAAMNSGIITLNEADASHSADQPWAGFGWGNTGEIHDWSTHINKAVFCETETAADECDNLYSWDGNLCYTRVTDFSGVTIEKSSSMAGSDTAWINAFSTDEYTTTVHMDGASVGHYLAMTFPTEQTFNGFRFECGGGNDGRNIEQNVFNLQYHNGDDWETIGTTNTADGTCGTLDTPGYAMWPAVYSSTQWRYILTEQHGGPWYHGFAWYTASGNAVDTIGSSVCTPTDIIAGQARDFEGGMGSWSCYSNPDSSAGHGNCHVHTDYNGRSSVAHIHGSCTGTQGGIQQTFATESYTMYTLKLLAYAGTWDGTDTDDFHIKVDNSDQSDWVQFSVEHSTWQEASLTFTAYGETTITIWSDANHCIDVDEIVLEMCSNCRETTLITGQATDFEGGMGGWGCYDNGNAPHGNCHTHENYNGRSSVAHIHGSCTGTQGGIQQTFETAAGTSYHLLFVAFAGTWDGTDTDDLHIKVSNSDKDDCVSYSIAHGQWANVDHRFRASGAVTITIWSDVNHCIDVDDITLQACTNEADVVTMEECSDNTDNVPMSSVTGQRSSISGDVVSIVIDYPGYMDLVSLSFVNGDDSPLDSWAVTVDDGCQNDNNAAQDFPYSTLTPVITRSGAFAEIGVTVTFSYYTHSELTESAERVTETKDIELGIRAPLTHVVSVTAPFQQGTGLLYDIESHGIVDEGNKQVVYVEFRTFVLAGVSFTGDCSVSSTYFSTETAECTTSNTEDFDHPTFGSGSIQTWMVRVQNPDQCQDAVHTERIDVDLALASGTSERIEFMVDMVDEAGPDCRVVIGDFDLTSSVQISDGSAWVNPMESNDMIFYLNNIMEFSVTFDSLMLPSYATLSSMSVTQNNEVKCDADCFDVIQFVCENCDSDRKSAGATYAFSVVLTDSTFTALPSTSTDTTFELNFALQYEDRRRQLAKAVDAHTVPIKVNLRDYDCKAPNAILSSIETVDCDVVSMTKTMICSAQGWKDMGQCAAPAERYFSIIGMVTSALVVLYLLSKAAISSKNIFKYEQVPLEIEA
jgi:hypothetical protein